MMVHTLPAASRPWNGLQPILVVGVLPQVVQVPVLARTTTHRVTTMTVTILKAILGRQVSQREDTACDQDGVDVSVGVHVGAVVGVGVHGQGVNLDVGLGVSLVVGSPLIISLDS